MPKTLKVEQVQGGSKKANSNVSKSISNYKSATELAKLARIGEARKARSAPYENMYQGARKKAINEQKAKARRK